MPIYRLDSTGTWKKLKAYRLNNAGIWKKLTGYRLNQDGVWKKIFGAAEPIIESTVTLTKTSPSPDPNSNYHNSTYPITLTGTKYSFSGANSYSYRFYSSPTGSAPWTPITTETSTTNPASGASSTVSYQLTNADFTSNTMYFQFRYTGTNTLPDPDISTTSESNIISVTFLDIPAPPSGFPFINQSTISVASTASSGTWTGSPTLYQWKWQYGTSNNTLTYQATPSISSISLSGTTATATVFNHGFKQGDSVSFSGINGLFNQSATSISYISTNSFSYAVSKTNWSFLLQYSINDYVTYNGIIYKALLATPNRGTWSFTTNYTSGQYADYNNQLYVAAANTPTPRAAWSPSTSYVTNQYVNYNNTLWQCTLSNTGQTPFEGSIYWSSINIYPGGSYWTLVNIYPTSTTYWQSQEGSTASSGTATGPNYYEGSSSSPISYTISSFPDKDYKTNTSLQNLTTRMNVIASNVGFTSSAYNSTARTIYGYPAIFLGTNTLTTTSASIIYSESNMNVYDIDVKRSISVTSAVVSGSNIVYTTSSDHGFSSSASVALTGFTPSSFNISGITIISSTLNTFTVLNVNGATGSATTNGTALGSIVGYPKINQTNSSPISITGLTGGGTYTAYLTPKNADSPSVSGVQKTTTFTTPSPPVNAVAPTISPLNNRSYLPVSTTLTATTGSWTNVNASTTYNYSFEYFESGTIGWVSLQSSSSSTYTAPSNYTSLYGTLLRCTVTATNSDGSNASATSTAYTMDQAVVVGTITPTTVTPNTSTNFSFSISHYPTLYTIDWGDNTTIYNSGSIASNTSTVNASVAHTYTTSGTYTITVVADPGAKSNTASVTVQEAAPGLVRNLTRVAAALNNVATDKRFTWDAPNTGGPVSKYQFKINSGSWADVPGAGSLTYVDLYSFNTGISNTVSIRAVGPGGNGTESSSGPFTLPVINTGPTASSITSSQATISWTSSNQSTYSLSIPGAPSTPYTGTTATSRTPTGLFSGTYYDATLTITSSTSDTHTLSTSFTTLFTGLTPTFGSNTSGNQQFTGSVTNYDTSYTWIVNTTAGSFTWTSAAINGTRTFTVSLLTNGQSSTVTITTTRSGYTNGSGSTTGSALLAALTPTFGSNTSTIDGYTGSVTNYDANYTWGISASSGSVTWGAPSGSTRTFTVTGLSAGGSSTVTVTTSRSGYNTGSANTNASALLAGLTPTFGSNTSGIGLFAGSVTNYNTLYAWSTSVTAGTFTWGSLPISDPGTRTFTVSGLTSGQSSTLTVTTTRSGYANGSAQTTGSATTASAPTGGSASISLTSGSGYPGSVYTLSKVDATGTPTPTASWIWRRADGGAGGSSFTGGSIIQTGGTTYTAKTSDGGYSIRAEVTWSNGVSPNQVVNTNSLVVLAFTVPGIVSNLSASSLLSGTNLNWSASWSAPSNTGGQTITGYRVYVERGSSSTGPWTATATQIPAGTTSPTYTAASPYSTTSTSVSGRVINTTSTWIRVYVAAVNATGTGSYTTAVG